MLLKMAFLTRCFLPFPTGHDCLIGTFHIRLLQKLGGTNSMLIIFILAEFRDGALRVFQVKMLALLSFIN